MISVPPWSILILMGGLQRLCRNLCRPYGTRFISHITQRSTTPIHAKTAWIGDPGTRWAKLFRPIRGSPRLPVFLPLWQTHSRLRHSSGKLTYNSEEYPHRHVQLAGLIAVIVDGEGP